MLIGEVIVGTTLLSRVRKAYLQIPPDTATHHTWSSLDLPSEKIGAVLPLQEQRPKIGRVRFAKYLAGVAPLASTNAPEVLDVPPAVARKILRGY